MSATVVLLLLAAVLLWPTRRGRVLPHEVLPLVRGTSDRGSSARMDGRSDLEPESRWQRSRFLRASAAEDPPPLTVEEVADATMLLALALRSGRGLIESLDDVAGVSPPAPRTDLVRVATALRWGRSMAEAWVYARPVWGPTATAFVIAQEVGAPSASVLLEAGEGLRETESRRLEEAGGRAAVMLVLPLGLCFLPAFTATAVVPLVVVLVGTQLG